MARACAAARGAPGNAQARARRQERIAAARRWGIGLLTLTTRLFVLRACYAPVTRLFRACYGPVTRLLRACYGPGGSRRELFGLMGQRGFSHGAAAASASPG